MALTGTVTDLH